MNNIIEYFDNIKPLSAGLRERLEDGMSEVSYVAKTQLFRPDVPPQYCYFVVKGILKAYWEHGNQRFTSQLVAEGDVYFDPLCLYGEVATGLGLVLLEDSVVCRIRYTTLRRLFPEYPEVLFHVQSLIAQKNAYCRTRMAILSVPARERIAIFIKQFPRHYYVLTQAKIGEFLALNPCTVCRILRANRKAASIALKRKK